MSATQEQINRLRTLVQQIGALVQQNDALLNEVAKESTLSIIADNAQTLLENVTAAINSIDLSPIEGKIDNAVATISDKVDNINLSSIENKIDNIKIDLSPIAKQGSNGNATNTAILSAIEQISYDKADVEDVIIFLSERV